MITTFVVLAIAVMVLTAALLVMRSDARRSIELEAQRLAQAMSQEVKREAEKKASAVADKAIKEVENASNDDLERIARDLVRGKRVP